VLFCITLHVVEVANRPQVGGASCDRPQRIEALLTNNPDPFPRRPQYTPN